VAIGLADNTFPQCVFEEKGQVLLIGGSYDPPIAEVVDLSTGISCPIKDYPEDLKDATGAFIDGKPTVCGGFSNKRECYSYNVGNDDWDVFPSTIMGRHNQASSVLSDGRWLITGGGSLPDNQMTFEIYDNGAFAFGNFNFTTRHSTHCQVISLASEDTIGFFCPGDCGR